MGVLLIATLIGMAVYSRSTYYVRAKKRLIQDQIYNLVMGVRQLDPFSDAETQVCFPPGLDRAPPHLEGCLQECPRLVGTRPHMLCSCTKQWPIL